MRKEEDMDVHDARGEEEFMDALRFGLVPCAQNQDLTGAILAAITDAFIFPCEDPWCVRRKI